MAAPTLRTAPPLVRDVHPHRTWALAVACLWLGACVISLAWAASHGTAETTSVALACLLLCSCAAWSARRHATGVLRWNGKSWHWQDAAAPVRGGAGAGPVAGDLSVSLDAGAWMLLCFRPGDGGRMRWIPAGIQGRPDAWHALRCAVYCRAPGAADGMGAAR